MVFIFDVWSDYAHFSHPATIYSSLSYPIPAKPTVIGMLASILGLSDLSEYLWMNDIKYSVTILNLDGKRSFCFNGIKDALPSINFGLGIQKIKQRKQFYRELLINPKYRLFIDFSACNSNLDLIEKLKKHIKEHISLFPIYLGINFCLANFSYVGDIDTEFIKNNIDFIPVTSFVPLNSDFRIEPEKSYSNIRFSLKIHENRFFSDFQDLLVELNGRDISAKLSEYYTLDIDHKKLNICMI
jgi:CRISPR-associated protein Cas5h